MSNNECTARLDHTFHGCNIVVSGYTQGRIQLTCDSNLITHYQVSSANPVSGIYHQPLDVLNRFDNDLLYFWVDLSSGMDRRIDLLAVKLAVSSEGDGSVHSGGVVSCFTIEDASMLVNSSLMGIQSRTTATVQTAVLDAAVLLGHAEKVRKGESTRAVPAFTSVHTVPVPTSEGDMLAPSHAAVPAGSASVIKLYPLLAADVTASDTTDAPFSDSVVLSCSYTVVVSYYGSRGEEGGVVAKCISKFVSAENQVVDVLRYRGVGVLADPDCEILLSNGSTAATSTRGHSGETVYLRSTLVGSGLLHTASSTSSAPVKAKLYQLCLDMGLILRDRRDAIDKLMKGEISTSKLSEKLSKNTARRIILMETCLSCELVNTICDYITALDSARFGYKNSAGSKSSGTIYSYSDLEEDVLDGSRTAISQAPREATAAGVDVGYVLRDVTRIHQWAVLLLEQLRTTAKDTILRRFVVPYLVAKNVSHTSESLVQIADMPVGYSRELAAYIRLCEGTLAVFRALINRKTMEINAISSADTGDVSSEPMSGGEVSWTATSLLDGQCVVVEALVAVLRIASLACSARGVSLPAHHQLGGGGESGSSTLLSDYQRRTTPDPEFEELSGRIFDVRSLVEDINVNFLNPQAGDATPKMFLIQDLLVDYVEKISGVLSGKPSSPVSANYLGAIFGDTLSGQGNNTQSGHDDRLTAFLFTPVSVALMVQRTGLRNAALALNVDLPPSVGRGVALDLYYIPMRHAFASILYTLLDSTVSSDVQNSLLSEDAIFGVAAKFGTACGSLDSTGIKGFSSCHLFPMSWSSGVAALWVLDSGLSSAAAVETLKSSNFESLFESRSGFYRAQSYSFLPLSPESLYRYVLCRLLYRGDWRVAKSLLRSQLSGGGAEQRLGKATYDIFPLVSTVSEAPAFTESTRARFLILSLAASMLQMDEWQTAWYATRKLCKGQSDDIRVELINMLCEWLFLNNRATELVNFTMADEDHQVLEVKLHKHASECIQLSLRAGANSRGMDVEGESGSELETARAVEAADIYVLYLLSRNKFTEAMRVMKNPQFKMHFSPDVSDLVHTNMESRNLLTRQFNAILSTSAKAQAEITQSDISISDPSWQTPDGVSSFEQLLRQN